MSNDNTPVRDPMNEKTKVTHAQSLRTRWCYQHCFSICCRGPASKTFNCYKFKKNTAQKSGSDANEHDMRTEDTY